MMRARVGRPFVQGRPADVGAGVGADGTGAPMGDGIGFR